MKKKIYMIGAFPPPVHGMSVINVTIKKHLASFGGEPVIINLSPVSLNRAWHTRFGRFGKILKGLISFLGFMFIRRDNNVYIGLTGGYGQTYDLIFIGIARLFRQKIFIHHHSYAYLTQPRIITHILSYVAGQKATHIVLCENMAQQLMKIYKQIKNVSIISNAAILDFDKKAFNSIKPKTLKVIGFIGNISRAKGIAEFIDVAKKLEEYNIRITSLIAGPFEDKKIESEVTKQLSELTKTQYLGPKYGKDKENFYNSIDVLLFPTQYINEAEPVTIHEAMEHGIPVIAFSRGCIDSIITPKAGLVVNECDNFVKIATQQLLDWSSNPAHFSQISSNARSCFLETQHIHQQNFEKLCCKLIKN